MDALQKELDITWPELGVQLLGVNQAGYDAANDVITDTRDIPWLQDVPEVLVWDVWAVGWRDLYILDGENRLVAVFNLTEHNLQLPAEYEALRDLLLQTAGVDE
jgi:hypothetical protein